MYDRRRDELHDALDDPQLTIERADFAGQSGVLGIALIGDDWSKK